MPKLIGFGASSVQGVGDSQGGFFKRLEAKLADAGHPHTCLNYGTGGNTTRDMLARLEPIQIHLPCPSIILLGCNDLPRERDTKPQIRVPLAEYAKNLDEILNVFAGPDTIFVSSFLACPQRSGVNTETFTAYMTEALKIAASCQLKTWDLYSESLAFGDKYMAEDGVHFNDAGHEMIAEHLAPIIINS